MLASLQARVTSQNTVARCPVPPLPCLVYVGGWLRSKSRTCYEGCFGRRDSSYSTVGKNRPQRGEDVSRYDFEDD